LDIIILLITVVSKEIKGQIRFYNSSRNDDNFRDMSGSVYEVNLEWLFEFSVVAWAYDLEGPVDEFDVAFTTFGLT
jgi:hypothetical protein